MAAASGDAALITQAEAAQARADWASAARHWQVYAARQNPVSTKSGTITAQDATARAARTHEARIALRRARMELALEAHDAGQMRRFRELAVRVFESLGDPRALEASGPLQEIARRYVWDALALEFPYLEPDLATPCTVLACDTRPVPERQNPHHVVETHERCVITAASAPPPQGLSGLEILIDATRRICALRPTLLLVHGSPLIGHIFQDRLPVQILQARG